MSLGKKYPIKSWNKCDDPDQKDIEQRSRKTQNYLNDIGQIQSNSDRVKSSVALKIFTLSKHLYSTLLKASCSKISVLVEKVVYFYIGVRLYPKVIDWLKDDEKKMSSLTWNPENPSF